MDAVNFLFTKIRWPCTTKGHRLHGLRTYVTSPVETEYKRWAGGHASLIMDWTHSACGESLIVLDVISWELSLACLISKNGRKRTPAGTVAFVKLDSHCVDMTAEVKTSQWWWRCSEILTDCADAFSNCQMSEMVKKIVCFVCCKWTLFFFSLGGNFHSVNRVYFSAEKVQFALHHFPKQTNMFYGLHTCTNQLHLQTGPEAVQTFFHHLVSTVKKYFLILQ